MRVESLYIQHRAAEVLRVRGKKEMITEEISHG
jgi:hypothetical protein